MPQVDTEEAASFRTIALLCWLSPAANLNALAAVHAALGRPCSETGTLYIATRINTYALVESETKVGLT